MDKLIYFWIGATLSGATIWLITGEYPVWRVLDICAGAGIFVLVGWISKMRGWDNG